MDKATIQRLNQINRTFYETTAGEFDQTRGRAWPGWERLLAYLSTPLSVLDIGCGNGRFGLFLADGLGGTDLVYHGIDSNFKLLMAAQEELAMREGLISYLADRDIIEEPPDEGEFDLVVLFGVLHHIPGAKNRMAFMKTIAERVKPGGFLCFAAWRFYEYERFRDRLVDWEPDIAVEKHDYLLDWRRGERALRYCHYVDDAEHAELIRVTGLKEVLTYRADGADNRMNCYSILRR